MRKMAAISFTMAICWPVHAPTWRHRSGTDRRITTISCFDFVLGALDSVYTRYMI